MSSSFCPRFAYVEELARLDCQEKYDDFLYGKSAQVQITPAMLCAGNETADACSGDSGGPLLWTERLRYTVGGVVSFGPSSCGNKAPGVYTKVASYLPWIKNTVQNS
jgi:secreted trypsin-like serine protease